MSAGGDAEPVTAARAACSSSSAASTSAAWPSGFDLRPDPGDPPVRVDEERRPRRAPVRLAVVLLLDPRAVGLGDLVLDVGEERERQAELLAECALARGALRADAPDVRAALDDRLVGVAELARLDGAAGRVVLRVEVEDRPSAGLVGQAMDRARSRLRGRPPAPGRRPRACSCRERSRGLDDEDRAASEDERGIAARAGHSTGRAPSPRRGSRLASG